MTSSQGDYKPGSMDISQHKKAYQGFLTGSKWTFILVMAIVIFMAIFRTHG
jgi:hypothetical protein